MTCNKMWRRILGKTDKNLNESSYTKGETVQQESKNPTASISKYENIQNKAPLKIKVEIGQNILCHSDQMYKLDSRKKGIAVIINNWMFDEFDVYPKRQGANVDAVNLGNLLGQLGFEVLHHENMDRIKMAKYMISLSETVVDNEADMVIVCILSYEGETGRPLSSDGYEIDIEVDVFRKVIFILMIISNDVLDDLTIIIVGGCRENQSYLSFIHRESVRWKKIPPLTHLLEMLQRLCHFTARILDPRNPRVLSGKI